MSIFSSEIRFQPKRRQDTIFGNRTNRIGLTLAQAPLKGHVRVTPVGSDIHEQAHFAVHDREDHLSVINVFQAALQTLKNEKEKYRPDELVFRLAPSDYGTIELGTPQPDTEEYLYHYLTHNSPHVLTAFIWLYHPEEIR